MPKFKTKNINDATPEELRTFAGSFLGIPLDDSDTHTEVLAKVLAAHDSDTIYISEEPENIDQTGSAPPPVAGQTVGGGLVGSLGRDDPKVTLTLHAEERDGVVVNRHKEVGVNGIVWLLKRGESITIPYRVFGALADAKRHVITHTSEGETREQVVQNTGYNIENMPPPAEVAEWHSKYDNMINP